MTKTFLLRNGSRITEDNRIVQRVWNPKTRRTSSHGKRVRADFPLPYECRRAYVKGGAPTACRWLMDNKAMTLTEAWELIKASR